MVVDWKKHEKKYGIVDSYKPGMDWLKDCDMVEDWGCALAYAKQFRDGPYRGIDGTAGAADVIADLETYRSNVQGIFMRHILEHNVNWRTVLQNALDSFTKRMSIVLFKPLGTADTEPRFDAFGRPELLISGPDFADMILPYVKHEMMFRGPIGKADQLFLLEKS